MAEDGFWSPLLHPVPECLGKRASPTAVLNCYYNHVYLHLSSVLVLISPYFTRRTLTALICRTRADAHPLEL